MAFVLMVAMLSRFDWPVLREIDGNPSWTVLEGQPFLDPQVYPPNKTSAVPSLVWFYLSLDLQATQILATVGYRLVSFARDGEGVEEKTGEQETSLNTSTGCLPS